MSKDILHSETFVLTKKDKDVAATVAFVIPLSHPHPPQYVIKVISERWVDLKFTAEFRVAGLLLPDKENAHTPLLDLFPLPKTAL